jgi:hypothetical protein
MCLREGFFLRKTNLVMIITYSLPGAERGGKAGKDYDLNSGGPRFEYRPGCGPSRLTFLAVFFSPSGMIYQIRYL